MYTATPMAAYANSGRRYYEEEEEPFDEPSSRHPRTTTAAAFDPFKNDDDAADVLSWTGSELDMNESDHRRKSNDFQKDERNDEGYIRSRRGSRSAAALGTEQRDDDELDVVDIQWSGSDLGDDTQERAASEDQRDEAETIDRYSPSEPRQGNVDNGPQRVKADLRNGAASPVPWMNQNALADKVEQPEFEVNQTALADKIEQPEFAVNQTSMTDKVEQPEFAVMQTALADKVEHPEHPEFEENPPPPPAPMQQQYQQHQQYQLQPPQQPFRPSSDIRDGPEPSSFDEDNNMAIRASRSIDIENTYTKSPLSVTASVTRRTRNTKLGHFQHYETDDDDTAIGDQSVLTAELMLGPTVGGCTVLGFSNANKTPKSDDKNNDTKRDSSSIRALSRDEEEDLLDRFFEGVQRKVCHNKGQLAVRSQLTEEEEEGFFRVFTPFLNRLEHFDPVFEQLEELACPEEEAKRKQQQRVGQNCLPSGCEEANERLIKTPVAYAASKFSEMLDRIETFDRCFANMEDIANREAEEASRHTAANPEHLPALDALDLAFEKAESRVIHQKERSFHKKDRLQKMKEQWFATRLKFKLHQQILAEAIQQKTAKAAHATTQYVDSVVAGCNPNPNNETNGSSSGNDVEDEDEDLDEDLDEDDDVSIDDSDFASLAIGSVATHQSVATQSVATPSVATRSVMTQSVMSPSASIRTYSEHSNIYSDRDFPRSFNHYGPTSPSLRTLDESSAMTYSDHVLRSPMCLSPESSKAPDNESIAADTTAGQFGNIHPSDEEEDRSISMRPNHRAEVGGAGRLAVISEEVPTAESRESNKGTNTKKKKQTTGSSSKKKDKQRRRSMPSSSSKSSSGKQKSQRTSLPSYNLRWGYPSPSTEGFKPSEWLDLVKETVETVYTVSERFLDKAACSSGSINLSESHSYEEDNDSVRNKDKRNLSRSGSKTGSSHRIQRQNSIVADDNDKNKNKNKDKDKDKDKSKRYKGSYEDDDDDLSGFATAVGTLGSELTDERPPMLRLQRSRQNDSRSMSSSSHSRTPEAILPSRPDVSGRMPHELLASGSDNDYTLADAIRNASYNQNQMQNNNNANNNKNNNKNNNSNVTKEPRGNKAKYDTSAHVRTLVAPLSPVNPTPQKPKLDPESNPELQEKVIRSPKSNETEDTARLTEPLPSTASDEESTTKKKPMVICLAAKHEQQQQQTQPKTLEDTDYVHESFPNTEDALIARSVQTSHTVGNESFKDCFSRAGGDDARTVYSVQTTHTTGAESFKTANDRTVFSGDRGGDDSRTVFSTGSESFKDCYEDAIPSLTTMATLAAEEEHNAASASISGSVSVPPPPPPPPATKLRAGGIDAPVVDTAAAAFLSSKATTPVNLVKSVTVLSVSAAVLGATTPREGIDDGTNANYADFSSRHKRSLPTPKFDNSSSTATTDDATVPLEAASSSKDTEPNPNACIDDEYQQKEKPTVLEVQQPEPTEQQQEQTESSPSSSEEEVASPSEQCTQEDSQDHLSTTTTTTTNTTQTEPEIAGYNDKEKAAYQVAPSTNVPNDEQEQIVEACPTIEEETAENVEEEERFEPSTLSEEAASTNDDRSLEEQAPEQIIVKEEEEPEEEQQAPEQMIVEEDEELEEEQQAPEQMIVEEDEEPEEEEQAPEQMIVKEEEEPEEEQQAPEQMIVEEDEEPEEQDDKDHDAVDSETEPTSFSEDEEPKEEESAEDSNAVTDDGYAADTSAESTAQSEDDEPGTAASESSHKEREEEEEDAGRTADDAEELTVFMDSMEEEDDEQAEEGNEIVTATVSAEGEDEEEESSTETSDHIDTPPEKESNNGDKEPATEAKSVSPLTQPILQEAVSVSTLTLPTQEEEQLSRDADGAVGSDHRFSCRTLEEDAEEEEADESISTFFRNVEASETETTTTTRVQLEPTSTVEDDSTFISAYFKTMRETDEARQPEDEHRSTLEVNDSRDEIDESITAFFLNMEEEADADHEKKSSFLEPGVGEYTDDAEDSVLTILRDIIQEEDNVRSANAKKEQHNSCKESKSTDSCSRSSSGNSANHQQRRAPSPLFKQRLEFFSQNGSPVAGTSSGTRAPISVEERRQRRLKQRRKFEKVLLGEDDSSVSSYSLRSSRISINDPQTAHTQTANEAAITAPKEEQDNVEDEPYVPLISASFDTVPAIRE